MDFEQVNSWDKKPKTVLRSIKAGDIFCFDLGDRGYAFGQILSKIATGHVAAIFDLVLDVPAVKSEAVSLEKLAAPPLVIDSYSLFDKKREGDWRIIGHREMSIPDPLKDFHFVYGVGIDRKKVDLFGTESPASDLDAARFPLLTPRRDPFICRLIAKT